MTKQGCVRMALLLGLLAWSSWSYADDRPLVAVFEFEQSEGKISKTLLTNLTTYLSAKLTEGGYQVIPMGQIIERLRSQKNSSMKKCYDQSCQIEIGRELAAQKMLSSKIMKIGSRCQLTATLYDLRKAAAERAATARGKCDEDSLLDSVDRLVAKLCAPMRKKAAAKDKASSRDQAAAKVRVKPKDKRVLAPKPVLAAPPAEKPQVHAQPEFAMNPYKKWGHVLVWSGVGLSAFGAVSYYLASAAAEDEEGGDWDAASRRRTWTGMMFTGFVAGGASLVTGLVLWTLSPGDRQWAENHALGLRTLPESDGWVLSWGGRW